VTLLWLLLMGVAVERYCRKLYTFDRHKTEIIGVKCAICHHANN